MSRGRTLGFGALSPTRSNLRQIDGIAQMLIAFGASTVTLTIVAAVAALLTAHFLRQPDLAALSDLFVVDQRSELNPEPAERAAYLITMSATVPAVAVWAHIFHRYCGWSSIGHCTLRVGPFVLAGLLSVTFVGSSFIRYVLTGDPARHLDIGADLQTVLLVGLAAAVAIALIRWTLDRKAYGTRTFFGKGLCQRQIMRWLSVAVCLNVLALRLRSAPMIYGDPHFEAVFYSVSQVVAGKTMLADLPSQYGLYAEMLHPLFAIIGLSVLKFTATMVVLQGLASFALLWVCRQLIRLPWLFALAFLTLLMFVGSTWVDTVYNPSGHEYYQIWPLRFVFPAISLAVFIRTATGGMVSRWIVLSAIIAGLALVWNLESGIAVFGALTGYLAVRAAFCGGPGRYQIVTQFLIATLVALAIVAAFFLYLFFKADGPIHPLEWFKYQRIFYLTGFGMLPMPLEPHPWMAVLGLYLFGLVGAITSYLRGQPSRTWDVLLYLSLLGFGLFPYYQGRSHDIVLSFVIWPAILSAFVIADRSLRAVRASAISPLVGWSVAPIVVFGTLMSLLWLSAVPKMFKMTYEEVATIVAGGSPLAEENVAFVLSKIGASKSAVILDPGQSVLFAETGLASAVPGPGMVETLLIDDQNRFIDALMRVPSRHLFIRLNPEGSVPHPYRVLLGAYRIVATDRNMLGYLVPSD